MPQISPIFWSLIVLLFTSFLFFNSESLPEMNEETKKSKMTKNKENPLKW